MKKWICALLAMCLLAVLPACAEGELPVLTAQLGKAAELAEQTEHGDEYVEVLTVEDVSVTMGRFAGEMTAEELGMMFSDDLHDGEMLIEGEDGVDQRAMFYTDNGGTDDVMDVTVLWLDGYTYGFVCVTGSDAYFGGEEEPLREQIDFWVSTLDIFDGEFAADPMGDITMMLLYDSPLYDEAELINSGAIGDGGYYMELMAEAGVVRIGEYTLPMLDESGDVQAALNGVAQTIHADAREFACEQEEELTLRLEYPAYRCRWMTGANEDTREVHAVIVTGEQTLALSVALSVDWAEDYADQVEALFDSVTLYTDSAEADGPYMAAEEIAFALLGDYMDYWYAWNETIEEQDYWVYEFADIDGECIGAVAVQEETGEAYISIGTDAMEAVYEPVLWDDVQGYYLPDSVG